MKKSVGGGWKLLVIGLFLLCMLAPVVAVMGRAIAPGHDAGFWTEATLKAFQNTLVLGVLVSGVSAVLAYLLAAAMVVTGFANRTLPRVLALLPFMAPPYLMSIGWILFMEPNGYLAKVLPVLSGVAPHFFTLFGLVCVMSLHLFPIPLISALRVVETIRYKYDAPASTHGASAWYRLVRIWFPLAGPAVIASSMLVFVKTIGEFGTPLIFGSLLHFPILTTTIYLQMTNWPINFHTASQFSSLLLGTVFVVWLVNDIYQRRVRFVDTSAPIHPVPATRRSIRLLALSYMLLLGVISVLIPIGSLFVTSVMRIEGNGLNLSNFSLIHYRHLFTAGTNAAQAIWTSLELAALAAVVVLLMSIALAVLVRFYGSRVVRLTEWVALLPNSIPDVLLAIGLILLWNASWWPVTVYNTPAMLVLGYAVVLFPFSYTYVRGELLQLSGAVWEAALTHQASKWRTAWRIGIPLMMTALTSGFMMVFGVALRDLVIPMFLSPPNTSVISMYIYGQFDQGSLPDAMALATITLVLTVTMLSLVSRKSLNRLNG